MFLRRSAVLAAGSAALLLLAHPATAHVTVSSPGATQGGFAKLSFRAPTEKDVPTTRLEIVFPADAPIPFVSVKPHVGWRYAVTKAAAPSGLTAHGEAVEQVVSRITWTATGPGIRPGEFDEFEVSAGPLPKVDALVFRALQTYQDGEVVRWIQTGEGELERPAPVLRLAAPQATPAPVTSPAAASVPVSGEGDDDAGLALVLGVLGSGLGGAALALSLVALTQGRRRAAP